MLVKGRCLVECAVSTYVGLLHFTTFEGVFCTEQIIETLTTTSCHLTIEGKHREYGFKGFIEAPPLLTMIQVQSMRRPEGNDFILVRYLGLATKQPECLTKTKRHLFCIIKHRIGSHKCHFPPFNCMGLPYSERTTNSIQDGLNLSKQCLSCCDVYIGDVKTNIGQPRIDITITYLIGGDGIEQGDNE